MLTILIGTDWITNRDAILQKIAKDVAAENTGRILIVPELISHDTERRLCVAAGDCCSRFAEVLSFSRLAKRVAEYDRCALTPCMDQGGRLVAMASATKQIYSKLKAYAAVETKPEFFSGLIDAVDEFKRSCISPADLLDASRQTEGSLAQKLEELSLILESYNSVCARGKCDPRDQMTWLLEKLEDSNYGADHVFYIDGFPDYTRQHLSIIKHLIGTSSNVTVGLACDCVGSEDIAFAKAGETASILIRMAEELGVGVQIERCMPIEHSASNVGKYLFSGNVAESNCDALRVIRAKTPYQECELALETVLNYVSEGARYRDINIACSDMATYRNMLEMLFDKCEIPLYISGTDSVLNQPAIQTVLSALEVVQNDFEQGDVLQYLKSMVSPLSEDVCDRIENYALMWGISGLKWTQPWNNHPDGLDGKWNETAEKRLASLNTARKSAIDPLIKLRKDLDRAHNLADMVRGLYDFLESIRYGRKLNSYADELEASGNGREAQVLNQLWDILLSALEQLYDTLGESAWEAENFLQLLKLLISQYDVGTIPPVLDAVSAGPMNVMRCQQCKYLIVLGAVEGAMPGYPGATGVLTDQERTTLRQLGLPLTGGSMDGLLAEFADIYGVFTSANTAITVSCSDGEPSFVYKRLAVLANREETLTETLGAAMGNCSDASAFLLRCFDESAAEELDVCAAYKEIARCKDHKLGNISAENVTKLYGSELRLSATQVDQQAKCRMAYFLKYGLRARERRIAEVDPMEFGTYVHAVLEATVRTVMLNGGIHNVSADEMIAIAKDASENYAKERFCALETDRVLYLFRRNWSELEAIVYDLWEEMQLSEFLPVGLEVGFGEGYPIPTIDVSGSHFAAKLAGKVDRIDGWNCEGKNYFRVVDYKTGSKDFDNCDLLNGYGMQMLLYLFAVQENGQAVVGTDAIPAGVQYFPARVPLITAAGALSEEELSKERMRLWKRKGLLLGVEHVLQAMEKTETPIRMPYSRKKDGSLSGNVADYKQFMHLRKFVFKRIGEMVDEIASGNVEPNPYSRGKNFDSCTYCPYGAACHKAEVENIRNYKSVTDKQFWEEIERAVEDIG